MDRRLVLHAPAVRGLRSSHSTLGLVSTFRPLVGPMPRIVFDISGPENLVEPAREGLPDGVAQPEAVAVRLRRQGVVLEWGDPHVVGDVAELLALCRERGRSSVHVLRTDASLVTELQIGSWFNAAWRGRLLRRLASRFRPRAGLLRAVLRGEFPVWPAADAAFWIGVRSAATSAEWRRLTRSSYVMLVYHRLAGEGKPSQERFDIDPRRFAAHLRLLRLAGFRHLSADDIVKFHSQAGSALPARSFALTVDDGFQDCVGPLRRATASEPQLFVCTRELGGTAHWAEGEPIMNWAEVAALAEKGVAIGAHGRHHRRLNDLTRAQLDSETAGALGDLRKQLGEPLPILAYPHGAHDERVRAAVIKSGYQAAYTTEKGRNGAGTDCYCLRRTSVHASDRSLAIVWKALTGESLPRLARRTRAGGAKRRGP
jgi:peptidoglycan/xylan/chitin deacetylase (PgdA/CDA1 family)